jgi:hypothetical protein
VSHFDEKFLNLNTIEKGLSLPSRLSDLSFRSAGRLGTPCSTTPLCRVLVMSEDESEAVALLPASQSEGKDQRAGDHNGAFEERDDILVGTDTEGGDGLDDDESGSASPSWRPKPGERVFVFALVDTFRRCPGSVVEVDEPRFTRVDDACLRGRCDCNHVEWGAQTVHHPTDGGDLVFVKTDIGPTVVVDVEDLRRMQSFAVGQQVLNARGELRAVKHVDERFFAGHLEEELRFHGLAPGRNVSLAHAANVTLRRFSVSDSGRRLEAIVRDVNRKKRTIDVRELQGKASTQKPTRYPSGVTMSSAPIQLPFSGEDEENDENCGTACPYCFIGLIFGPIALLCVVWGIERKQSNVFAILIGTFLSTTTTIVALGVALSDANKG